MSVEVMYINPFNLESMCNTWQASEGQPLVQRGASIARSGIYDLFVKNPYELTVGNLQGIAEKPLVEQVGQAAVAGIGAAYTLMLYGGVGYFAGSAIHGLGTATASPLLTSFASKVMEVGETVFLCGSVPIYGAVYALPKRIIQNVPAIFTFVQQKIANIANAVFTYCLAPLWNHVIVPTAQAISTAFTWTVIQCVHFVNALVKKVALVAQFVVNNVILPVIRTIAPVVRRVADTCVQFASLLVEKITTVATWVINTVIAPVAAKIGAALRWGATQIVTMLKTVGTALLTGIENVAITVTNLAKWTFLSLIVPLWNNFVVPIGKALGTAFSWVATQCFRFIGTVVEKVAVAARFIFNAAIVPIVKTIASGITWVATQCVKFMGAVIDKVAAAAQLAYQYVIRPLWNYIVMPIVSGSVWLCNHTVVPLAQMIGVAGAWVVSIATRVSAAALQKIADATAFFNIRIIQPAIVFTQEKAQAVIANVEQVLERISLRWHSVSLN